MPRYKVMIEEMMCYSIILEVEDTGDEDLNEEAMWDKFHDLDGSWYDHPTCMNADAGDAVHLECYPLTDGEYEDNG